MFVIAQVSEEGVAVTLGVCEVLPRFPGFSKVRRTFQNEDSRSRRVTHPHVHICHVELLELEGVEGRWKRSWKRHGSGGLLSGRYA